MQIDETLARYSDFAFMSAMAIYALATVLLIVQYASARAKQVAARELVPAGDPGLPGRIETPEAKPLAERLGNMAFSVLVVGAVLHIGSIVLRGFATHRFPLGNMYEFVTMAARPPWCRPDLVARSALPRHVGVRAGPGADLMFLAGTVLYADAAPVVPALRSYWLPIHVTIVSIGSGVFLVSGVASLLYLFRMRQPAGEESTGILGTIARRLPDARTLDQLAYKTTIIGFPLFGAGVILGAIWAEAAWGRFWGWDPKETCSFIAWVLYAAYLHARATSGWRDTKAAWINIAGFVAMLFNLFIINMVISGLHSYAGLT